MRRSPYAFFYLEDAFVLEPLSLLRGEAPRRAPKASILALSILTGERHELKRAEFDFLLSLPADEWVDADGLETATVDTLTARGLLLSDREEGPLIALRERDEALAENAWNLYAALYHYMTQWSGVATGELTEDAASLAARGTAASRAHAAVHGQAPGPFAEVPSKGTVRLPGTKRKAELYRRLTERRTTRAFDTHRCMTLDQLDTVLLYVFGCHGYAQTSTGAMCIKRTSASAGAMHPTEVYPIVSDVAGITPGIYHYCGRDHSLSLQRELDSPGARRLASLFMCGQNHFGDAHVSFVLTARFYRSYWKYRVHQKAYAALLMDAAHLSQTLYLVSAELGLGAFVTLAINSRDIEADFGLDGVSEGVIAMVGCGLPSDLPSPLDLHFTREPSI